MTSVKRIPPSAERHATLLLGLVFRRVRDVFATEDWGELRQSHFRVVSSVPPGGISVTDLAERLGMSKQGCGQFVASLAESGHLRVETRPDDRRVRLVSRTRRGDGLIRRVTTRNRRIETEWAAEVGEERYRIFREVLEEIALGGDEAETAG